MSDENTSNRKDTALQCLDAARASLRKNKLDKAVSMLERSIRTHPLQEAEALLAKVKAVIEAKSKQTEEAVDTKTEKASGATGDSADWQPPKFDPSIPAGPRDQYFGRPKWLTNKTMLTISGFPILACIVAVYTQNPTLACVIILLTVASVSTTVGTCYYMHNSQGRLIPGLYFPAISQLGVWKPEQTIYQFGFTLSATLLATGIFLFYMVVGPHLLMSGQGMAGMSVRALKLDSLTQTGMLSCIGVATQGLFTLEFTLSPKSLIHWAGTGLFAWAAFGYCNGIREMMAGASGPVMGTSTMQISLMVKQTCLERFPMLMFAIPILFQVLVASRNTARTDTPAPEINANPNPQAASVGTQNVMGMMQWMVIGMFLVFFGSFALDFLSVAQMN